MRVAKPLFEILAAVDATGHYWDGAGLNRPNVQSKVCSEQTRERKDRGKMAGVTFFLKEITTKAILTLLT